MLDEAWRWKRRLSPVDGTAGIDELYARGPAASAFGGKRLGAAAGSRSCAARPADAPPRAVGLPEWAFSLDGTGIRLHHVR